MIKFFKKVCGIYNLALRFKALESEINLIETRLKESVKNYSKDFEKHVHQMTFDYTRNLDDTKSDYLKRYLEVNINSIQNQVNAIQNKIDATFNNVSVIKQELKQLIHERNKKE